MSRSCARRSLGQRRRDRRLLCAGPLAPRSRGCRSLGRDMRSASLLTDDAEMRTLNRTWRGKDAADQRAVLSGERPARMRFERAHSSATSCSATRQLEEAGEARTSRSPITSPISWCTACCICSASTTCEDDEAEQMETLESAALASLGIADPYAEDERRAPAEVSP